ncbi:hypothetical protein HQ619_07800 [Burkholderia gladioli]|jgi:hypothetical protein|uniref:hypothetical protein n=1 Tax=Burkholderia gladioli TaxID=28095 RepID=UPI00155F61E9|nr:hypothetical protein [Burkholderia gladioli]NRF83829.1 hypothetical protein [Burkholderia gladioli]
MKKIAAILILAAPLLANAKAEAQPTVLKSSAHTVGYVSSVKAGVITTAQAWEGTEVVQLDNGTCQKVVHSDLRIEKSGDAEKAVYKESKSAVECPA